MFSFWGYFSLNPETLFKSLLAKDYETLIKYLKDKKYEVKDLYPISNDMVLLSYREADNLCSILPHQNIVIAAFTTAMVCVNLYNKMEQLDYDQLLYTGNFFMLNH